MKSSLEASEGCSALFERHYAVRIWGEFRQAGFVGAGLVGKHRVFAGGTGGAACVWKAGRVLVQTDWQVQIFLNRKSRNVQNLKIPPPPILISYMMRDLKWPTDRKQTLFTTLAVNSHLVRRHWERAIQVFHKLFEGRSLRWCSVPAVPHHHISEQTGREMERESKHIRKQHQHVSFD